MLCSNRKQTSSRSNINSGEIGSSKMEARAAPSTADAPGKSRISQLLSSVRRYLSEAQDPRCFFHIPRLDP